MYRFLFLILKMTFIFSCIAQTTNVEIDEMNSYKLFYKDTVSVLFYVLQQNDTTITLRGLNVKNPPKFDDGTWIVYYDENFEKPFYQVDIKNNEKTGLEIEWYLNGNKKKESKSQDFTKYWYPNGVLKRIFEWNSNPRINKYYSEQGILLEEMVFINGRAIKSISYHPNGIIKNEVYYKYDMKSIRSYTPYSGIGYNNSGQIIGTLKFVTDTVTFKDGNQLVNQIVEKILIDSIR